MKAFEIVFCILLAVGLSGHRHAYEVGSSANVICYSNFTVVSMQWFTMNSNVAYSTERTNNNELLISTDLLLRNNNGTIFTCEVIVLLPTNVTEMDTIEFHIITSQKCKYAILLNCTKSNIIFLKW